MQKDHAGCLGMLAEAQLTPPELAVRLQAMARLL
jgi:hypothetical protein